MTSSGATVFISADMEGATGVSHWQEVTLGSPEHSVGRTGLAGDVNAAIAGAFEGGAERVVVYDAHAGHGRNLLSGTLDPRAVHVSGAPGALGMLTGLDETVDAAFFIGYHARAGTLNAVLDHSFSSPRVANIWLDDQPVGEIGMNQAVCSSLGVPVILVTGDLAACQEAQQATPPIPHVAAVKRGIGRYGASHLHPEAARALISAQASEAVSGLRRHAGRHSPSAPTTLRVQFVQTDMADRASVTAAAQRVDGRTVEVGVDSPVAALSTLYSLLGLAATYTMASDPR